MVVMVGAVDRVAFIWLLVMYSISGWCLDAEKEVKKLSEDNAIAFKTVFHTLHTSACLFVTEHSHLFTLCAV